MRCPRCQGETGPEALRCAACGAPLALPAEAPARPLDRPLDLERRAVRAPDVPAARPAPVLPPRDLSPPGAPLVLQRGGTGRRLVAWLVDAGPFLLVGVLLVAWLGAGQVRISAELLAVVALASFTYQVLAHWLLGATLGKRLVGLRVVGPDGLRPGPGRSALRAGLAIAGVLLLGAGPLLALFTRSGRGLHDLGAGTTVVRDA